MITTTPEQRQAALCALLTAHQTAWRSLAIRCETGEPFTRDGAVEMFEVWNSRSRSTWDLRDTWGTHSAQWFRCPS